MPVTSLGVVAAGTYVGAAGTLTMPFLTNIPRTDAGAGATVIFVWATVSTPVGNAGLQLAFSDDAAEDPYYGTCYFSDGLNQYSGSVNGAAFNQGGALGGVTVFYNQGLGGGSAYGVSPHYLFGVAFNPITTSNNLICTITGADPGAVNVFAIAYTGCALQPGGGSVDTPLFFWHTNTFNGGMYGEFTDLTDSRTSSAAQWAYNSANISAQPDTSGTVGPPFLVAPSLRNGTVVLPNWQINGPGDLVVYTIADINHGPIWPGTTPPAPYGGYDPGSSGAWVWGGAGPTTVNEFDDYDGNGDGMLASMLVAEQPLGGAAPITGQDISGSWAGGIASTYTMGGAFTLQSGAGPAQCVPPVGAGPMLNNRFRAA